jgi:hypothetical protein
LLKSQWQGGSVAVLHLEVQANHLHLHFRQIALGVLYNPQKSARLGNAVSGSAIVVCLLETLCFDSWINCLGFVN